jgi:hypothetical protein
MPGIIACYSSTLLHLSAECPVWRPFSQAYMTRSSHAARPRVNGKPTPPIHCCCLHLCSGTSCCRSSAAVDAALNVKPVQSHAASNASPGNWCPTSAATTRCCCSLLLQALLQQRLLLLVHGAGRQQLQGHLQAQQQSKNSISAVGMADLGSMLLTAELALCHLCHLATTEG